MLMRFYWWIGMDISTRWWLRRCLKASKNSRQTIRWPTLSLPLPNGPGVLASLPTTPRGNSYILLFTDRFSRRADMYATTEANLASGTADTLVDRYTSLWGYPITLLSDNGLRFCSKLFRAPYERIGIKKNATSSYHPCTNGGVERVNHTMTLMLAMVGDE